MLIKHLAFSICHPPTLAWYYPCTIAQLLISGLSGLDKPDSLKVEFSHKQAEGNGQGFCKPITQQLNLIRQMSELSLGYADLLC
jgi:hypothetical protein